MNNRPITQASLAEELGISRATVAEILGGRNAHRYNEETRHRVIEAAKAKGYRPNRSARLLTGARSGVIGIIRSISQHRRNAEFVLGAAEAIQQRGYEVLSGDIYRGGGLERAVTALLDAKVEGVLIAHMSASKTYAPQWKRLTDAGIPIVSFGGDPYTGFPYVTPDYFQAVELIVENLAACGYDKLAMFGRKGWDSPLLAGYPGSRAAHGFLHAARKAGYDECNAELLAFSDKSGLTPNGEDVPTTVRRLIKELLQRRGSATYGLGFILDYHAMLALQVCHEHGVRIPEDVGVMVCDGGYAAEYLWPPLSAIELPTQEVAHRAVELLFQRISGELPPGEATFSVPCKAIIRGSTRPLPTGKISS